MEELATNLLFDKSQTIGDIALALSKAQSNIKNPTKNSVNPFFKNRYADLSAVIDSCRPALSSNDIAIIQSPCSENGNVGVITMLIHKSGEWISGKLLIKPSKLDPQGSGSAITYARRYSLAAMVGVAQEDDDAEGSINRKTSDSNINEIKTKIESCESRDELNDIWASISSGIRADLREDFSKKGKEF